MCGLHLSEQFTNLNLLPDKLVSTVDDDNVLFIRIMKVWDFLPQIINQPKTSLISRLTVVSCKAKKVRNKQEKIKIKSATTTKCFFTLS